MKKLLAKLRKECENKYFYAPDFQEYLSKELLDELGEIKMVGSDINSDTHWWYEKATTVFKLSNGKYLGVRGATSLFSESMCWNNINVETEFFEVIPNITYERI